MNLRRSSRLKSRRQSGIAMIDYSIAVSLIAMVLILAIGSFRTGVASMLCDAQNGIDIDQNGISNYINYWYGNSQRALITTNGRTSCRMRTGALGNLGQYQYWSYPDTW